MHVWWVFPKNHQQRSGPAIADMGGSQGTAHRPSHSVAIHYRALSIGAANTAMMRPASSTARAIIVYVKTVQVPAWKTRLSWLSVSEAQKKNGASYARCNQISSGITSVVGPFKKNTVVFVPSRLLFYCLINCILFTTSRFFLLIFVRIKKNLDWMLVRAKFLGKTLRELNQ